MKPTRKLKNKTVYELIKRDIITYELSPGAEVSEVKLAERYGFGMTPIRQALARITVEGLIIKKGPRKHKVAPISLRLVQEVFELRLLLEPHAGQLVAHKRDVEALSRLDELHEVEYTPGDRDSEIVYLEANRKLHTTIGWMSGNERLGNWIEQLHNEMTRILHLGFLFGDHVQGWGQGHKGQPRN